MERSGMRERPGPALSDRGSRSRISLTLHPGYGVSSLQARLLLLQQRAIDVVGKADTAGAGKGFRVFLGEERAPHANAGAAAERTVAVGAGHHLAEHRVEEHGLEIFRLRARLGADVAPGGAGVGGRAGAGQAERACRRQRAAHAKTADVSQRVARRRHDGRAQRATARSEAERGRHHITSMSAWMAPEALMACRMEIMSRGPMPSALRPSTSCCSDMPSLTSARPLPSSRTLTRERGTTTVWPRDNGAGWLTSGRSEMVTVRLPCATATVDTRTSRPMTIMPERSSITILPARSGSICSCSISVSSDTTLPAYFSGMVICTVEGSSGSAVAPPMKSLMAPAMRLAVVKSGLRSARRTWLSLLSANSISRSMIAPLAMRPTVGTPRVIFAASPSTWKPPMASEPWATA